MVTIKELNGMTQEAFTKTLGSIFEHSPWVAENAWDYHPFDSTASLHRTMVDIVETAETGVKLELIRQHPQLGAEDKMSFTSTKEQKGAGLNELSDEEFEQFVRLNEEYVQKFGFPFILAVKGKTKRAVYESLQARLGNERDKEFQTAMNEIYQIAQFRLEDTITQ